MNRITIVRGSSPADKSGAILATITFPGVKPFPVMMHQECFELLSQELEYLQQRSEALQQVNTKISEIRRLLGPFNQNPPPPSVNQYPRTPQQCYPSDDWDKGGRQ